MTSEKIEEYIERGERINNPLSIHFKDRDTLTGIFIKGADYQELKIKNFWRVISGQYIKEWQNTRNENLSRIFNGNSFSQLSEQQ